MNTKHTPGPEVRIEPYKLYETWFGFLYVGTDQYDINPCKRRSDLIAEGYAMAKEMGLSVSYAG